MRAGSGQINDVDFVPDWYRKHLGRQAILKRQYIALAGLFLAMAIWNGFSMRSISIASASVSTHKAVSRHNMAVCAEFEWLLGQIRHKRRQVAMLQRLSDGLDPGAVVAELSDIIDPCITVDLLEVRCRQDGPWLTMHGFAREPAAIADLIAKMDRSDYLAGPRLVYSRQSDDHGPGLEFQLESKARLVRFLTDRSGHVE